jgi:hypothetical protein
MFWQLPRAAVCGILNGMEDDGGTRPALASGGTGAEVEAFFASKAAAKLAFQAAKGLQVGNRRIGTGASGCICPGVNCSAPRCKGLTPCLLACICESVSALCRRALRTSWSCSWAASPTKRAAT